MKEGHMNKVNILELESKSLIASSSQHTSSRFLLCRRLCLSEVTINLLLTIAAIGIAVFGILFRCFTAVIHHAEPVNAAEHGGDAIGEATKNPARFQFHRATNAIFTAARSYSILPSTEHW